MDGIRNHYNFIACFERILTAKDTNAKYNNLMFSEGRSCHPDLSTGGAFQVSLSQLQLDFYPYHLAIGDRSTWIRYQPDTTVHTSWLETSLKHFQTQLLESIKDLHPASNGRGSSHAPLSRTGLQVITKEKTFLLSKNLYSAF